jgi:glycolate oxidase FAD binding subunit
MDGLLKTWIERVQQSAADGTPLRLRGGGSKDFYGQALHGEIFDTRTWRGIVSYEPTELVVTVRAGTALAELEAELAASGQYLPFEPPHFDSTRGQATVGGMVAAGLNGPARLQTGAVRDYILGAELINGRGELLRFGGQVMKNVAGYDVARVLAGSLGTLGLITEVSLKVLPLPVAETTLVFECGEAQALTRMQGWLGTPLPINATCWHEQALSVRLRGARAALEAAQATLGGQVLAPDLAQTLWRAVREQTAPFFQHQADECLVRVSVPDTTPPLDCGPTLVEWGGAQRWIKLRNADVETLAALRRGPGHATVFRAANHQHAVFSPLSAPLMDISRRLKQTFDPAGIFNRGRLYPDW